MKKRHSVTQKEIARRAGVSQTAVSLALNNSYGVTLSDDTRQRVLDVAAELGYVPQAAARSLVQGHTNNIGLALVRPHNQVFKDPYIPNVMTGLSTVLRARGYRLLVEHGDVKEILTTASHLLKGGEVAGIVISGPTGVENAFEDLISADYPIVVLNESSQWKHSVKIDHQRGIQLAVDHILALGHQQVACIHYGPNNNQANWRVGNLVDALAQHGIQLETSYIQYAEYDPETGYAAMRNLLRLRPVPTAVFGMNDMMAIGAMRAIQDAGLHVPNDIAVIGYDDMRFAEFTNPALTTVRSPETEQGHQAGELILRLIEGRPIDGIQKLLPTELIVRTSCGHNQ